MSQVTPITIHVEVQEEYDLLDWKTGRKRAVARVSGTVTHVLKTNFYKTRTAVQLINQVMNDPWAREMRKLKRARFVIHLPNKPPYLYTVPK
jgi:hypothetical protein